VTHGGADRSIGLGGDASTAPVAVAVINYEGGPLLPACLRSLLAQTRAPEEMLVVDNGSRDESVALVRAEFPVVRLVTLERNRGYAGGANVAIRETRAPFVVLLNPDVVLTPTFLAELVTVAERRPEAGSLTGKLLRPPRAAGRAIIDSTGHVVFRNRWAVNRGEGEEDGGRYDQADEVFGVSGAAPFYRRAMLEDVRVDGEVFAESFFIYLEDVDLDWRARLRGWKAYYVPTAVAYHERGYKGGVRRRDSTILRHSLKNRYLLMIRNDDLGHLLRDVLAILPMELLRPLDFLLTTPRALQGYVDVLRALPGAVRQRRKIRRAVRVPPQEIRRWFCGYPYRAKMLERVRLLWARAGPG
jgi:GT2 family glycosyltransferase